MDTVETTCPHCGTLVGPNDSFCPHCGTKLGLQTITLARQIYMYSISLFLPPFGLIWTFKYLNDPNKRVIGFIAGVITIVSLFLTIWLSIGLFQGIQSQMSQYSGLGL